MTFICKVFAMNEKFKGWPPLLLCQHLYSISLYVIAEKLYVRAKRNF